MKRKNLIIQLALSMLFPLQNASAQKGYPEREGINGIYEKFQTPPPGYGEVPFYWWQADTLTKERLTWQLDELAKKKISSLQINYSHTDDRKGYFLGSSYKSVPAQFTEEWWQLFGWFMKEANQRGMTVSVSDYTLGVGQGYAIDEVRKLHPDIAASELVIETKDINGGERYEYQIKNELVSITAFNKENPKEHIVLTDNVSNGQVKWNCPKGKWTVAAAYSVRQDRSYNPMHPLAGKEYVRCFFQRFEDKFPNDSKGALNFFFSDELNFNLKGIAWDERFAAEFQKRKGYDIRPLIAALKMDIGAITTKVRLDYNDVFTSLSEENFFIPVYNWHAERNLIYGCDHGGRGRDVDEFGDYFRTQRWNQGPGSDQPRLGKNIIKAKVASSIAHMYNRPRVWLEGFYSSGWGTTSGKLLDAIFANYAMGYNLLSLHGLYYATPGSMWEWAPPCNHFRMPYWAVMDKMLEATERLSYLLSQGYHKCDVAIVYPVEPTVAGYGNNASDTAFKAGEMLYNKGIDFDFVDYSSLMKAKYNNGHLNISGEEYKAVIVPSMKAIRDSALVVLAKFASQGGTVINIGDLPETTEAYGKDEKHVGKLVAEMTSGKNFTQTENCDNLDIILDKHFVRDFNAVDNQSNDIFINHRKADSLNIYGIYNAEKNSRCFFRCHGDVEYWDIWSGEKYKIENCEKTEHGTIVNMPKGKEEFQIIVFTPRSKAQIFKDAETESIKLADKWECEIVPVLDNRFGDYHYPGTKEKLRPEIRHYNYILSKEKSLKEAKLLAEKFVVDRNSGIQFFELNGGSLLLNIDDVRELDDWHLIIFNQNLVSVKENEKIEIIQPSDTIRLTTVVKNGSVKLDIYNEEEYLFANPQKQFLPAKKHFIYGQTDDDTGLIVNDFVNVSLHSNSGKILNFGNPVFGWLSGPNGTQVYLAQLGKIAVSVQEQENDEPDDQNELLANWLSGEENDKFFEFSLASESSEFVASEEIKSIHVNVGTSAYGWNVSFDNGIFMSLRDLQEFESKHGELPSANGEISHGSVKLKFSNVEKIVVYQTPQYFGYGRK